MTAMVPMEKKEFQVKLNDFMDDELSLEQIIEKTDAVENFFLTVKHAWQMWHGVAYGKLTKNAEKKEYRERYGLKQDALKQYALTVNFMMMASENPSMDGFLTDQFPSLSFSHFRLTAPLLKTDFDKGVELLQKAEDLGMTRDEVYAESLEIRQHLGIEDKAQRIKKDQKISIADARKKAEANDKKDRLQKAAKAKLAAYNKAKEVVEKFEKTNAITDGAGEVVSATDAEAALKVLYRFASKAAHSDANGGDDKEMVKVNAAKSNIEQFIKMWR